MAIHRGSGTVQTQALSSPHPGTGAGHACLELLGFTALSGAG